MEKEKKPIYKKWWFWLAIALLVIGVVPNNNNTQNEVKNEAQQTVYANSKIVNEVKSKQNIINTNVQTDTEEKEKQQEQKNEIISNNVEKEDKINKTNEVQSKDTNKENTPTTKPKEMTNPDTTVPKATPPVNENSKVVWVGDTGTKYHVKGCRTLKGKGHQITLEQALKEGRQPCKVCH